MPAAVNPLVLLHGWAATSRVWGGLIAALPNFGRSTVVAAPTCSLYSGSHCGKVGLPGSHMRVSTACATALRMRRMR